MIVSFCFFDIIQFSWCFQVGEFFIIWSYISAFYWVIGLLRVVKGFESITFHIQYWPATAFWQITLVRPYSLYQIVETFQFSSSTIRVFFINDGLKGITQTRFNLLVGKQEMTSKYIGKSYTKRLFLMTKYWIKYMHRITKLNVATSHLIKYKTIRRIVWLNWFLSMK